MSYPNALALELARSCSTRWSSRSLELEKFLRRFDCILDTLSIFENNTDAETSPAATYSLGSLQTNKFVTLLVFFGKLYEHSDICTEAFQKSIEIVSFCLILLAENRERLFNFEFTRCSNTPKNCQTNMRLKISM